MAKTLTIKEKILAFLEVSGIKKVDFFERTGIQSSNFKGSNLTSAPGSDMLVKILTSYPELSAEWLMTGKGDMLKNEAHPRRKTQVNNLISESKDNEQDRVTQINNDFYYSQDIATRPRIPFAAAAGALSIATNAACDADCERFPVITTFPAYDFTIKIEGDSMAPDYLSGDELACRFVDYPANIKWGEPHILDTRDGVVFKIPYFGGDQIMCRSINPDGPSFLVDCADVLHVASIVGFTRQLQS